MLLYSFFRNYIWRCLINDAISVKSIRSKSFWFCVTYSMGVRLSVWSIYIYIYYTHINYILFCIIYFLVKLDINMELTQLSKLGRKTNKLKKQFKFLSWKEFGHSFHLVKPSCLPTVTGIAALLLVSSIVFYWNPTQNTIIQWLDSIILHMAVIIFFSAIIAWLVMVVYESGLGYHTTVVRRGLRLGIILFIVSEVMFFFSLFWCFFHHALVPTFIFGYTWPPFGLKVVSIWELPLVNTILLLSSGVTITSAHHYIRAVGENNSRKFLIHLAATIILGLTFLGCQWIEYTYGVMYRWADHTYGDIFFLTTGFHGFHVLLGTYGLLFCFARSLLTNGSLPKLPDEFIQIVKVGSGRYITNFEKFNFSSVQHIGFEAALWYWHFVDVVWIFLFTTIYAWSSPF